jgi:TOMM system kinase/cyclase fusion protein
MTFDEVLGHVLDLLQREGRVSYRALKRRFALDDDYLEDLKAEIIHAKKLAIDEDGVVLVWTGASTTTSTPVREAATPSEQLADKAVPPELPGAGHDKPEAERRQLTVMFCDLVGSTTLSAQLDPEELREVVRAYQDTCAKVIARYDGHIAQYLGDGLQVYFGYPLAHEDDAQRAVRAGLGIVEAMAQLNARLWQERGVELSVRLGIHTGLVVVGEMGGGGRQERLALGDTPNLAARLQGLAAPDTVVISAATHRLVQGMFIEEDLGLHTLKGVATPVSVYQVLGESGVQSRLEVAATVGLTPLVGREQEVGLLLERWAQVKEGQGQVVLLNGEPGIGKSRLVQVLKERVAGEPHLRWECRCSPYYQNTALYPVIELMQRALWWQREDAPEEKLRKLEEALTRYGMALAEVVPLLAPLLSLPGPAKYPALTLNPQRQRQKTLEAVLAVLLRLAEQQPLLLIVEDLHWIDPSTLELLGLLIDQGPTTRILALLTCRPEFHPSWGFRAHLTPLTLSRLPHTQVEVMVAQVAGAKALPAEVLQQVVAKTDGIPLFVEELTKMVLESGLLREREDRYELTGPLPPLAIPSTLQDSLMARLDRLAAVKEVAQLGATLGRSFTYEVLRAVSLWDEATLQQALQQLVEAELLYQRGLPPQATYLFKHALVQETAYQSVLKSRRQQSHQRIAHVLKRRFPETAETQPELLAYHYTEAGLTEYAIPYWQRAAKTAVQRHAYREAIEYLKRALALLQAMPETPQLIRQEIEVQLALGPALMVVRGFTAPEVADTYSRARQLCEQLGDRQQLFSVLFGLWRFSHVRAQLRTARGLGEQLVSLATYENDPALLVEAHGPLGQTLCIQGELSLAREHLHQVVALYKPHRHSAQSFRFGYDPGVYAHAIESWVLWLLGYPEQALRRGHEALTLARAQAHPFTLSLTLVTVAVLHQMRQEGNVTLEHAKASLVLSTEHEFPYLRAIGTVAYGWALAVHGQTREGIARIRQALSTYRSMGAELFSTYWLVLLVEAHETAGQTEEGLHAVDEALAMVDTHGERIYEAELYRLKGELRLQQAGRGACPGVLPRDSSGVKVGQPARREAEACFHQALDVARRQQARSLELRAAMSLSRLWQRQGQCAEAYELLAPIYGWFTEGFDTADLQEATALLEVMR